MVPNPKGDGIVFKKAPTALSGSVQISISMLLPVWESDGWQRARPGFEGLLALGLGSA
jgi:hypothetical protein